MKDLTDQPLTSSIWGKRIKDRWYRELKWLIQENICEILITIASLVCIYFIIKAWVYHGSVNL